MNRLALISYLLIALFLPGCSGNSAALKAGQDFVAAAQMPAKERPDMRPFYSKESLEIADEHTLEIMKSISSRFPDMPKVTEDSPQARASFLIDYMSALKVFPKSGTKVAPEDVEVSGGQLMIKADNRAYKFSMVEEEGAWKVDLTRVFGDM